MTLILTLGDVSGLCQSSDYQLTDRDTGAPVSDRAGCKQLQAGFKGLDLRLAFTGIAEVGTGQARQRTIDWLSAELKALPHNSDLQNICEALKKRSAAMMSPHGPRGVLELVLTIATVGEPFRVAVVSNADWSKRPPEARPQFTIAIHTITKPFHLISGYRDCVLADQRHRLRALAREIENSTTDVLDALAEINAIAARNSGGCVSEDCWVTSQFADGRIRRSASRNIGQHPGDIHSLFGSLDLSEFVRRNFRAAPGKEISIVQTAGVIAGPGDATPMPVVTGDPRRFMLSGSSVTGLLRTPAGDHCASITITQLENILEMRCNGGEANVSFSKITLGSVGSIGVAFPKPLYPWPQLSPAMMIDGVAVPRGWEYSVGYWIEDKVHHVVISESHRPIRNLAFLGAEDEVMIVAPSPTVEFAWGEGEAPSATMNARVSWRSRLA